MDARTAFAGTATSHARAGGDVVDAVEHVVEEQPWVQSVTRIGWLAKGAVYSLMGLTAFTIGRGEPTPDDASPEGALAQVVSNPAGPLLLGVLVIGLVLYAAWRLLTAVLVRGRGVREWLDRIGYLFSASFYAVLAFVAVRALLNGDSPEDSKSVERLSSSMLQSSVGRWILLLAGLVAIGVGVYFLVEKGVRRSFRRDLTFESSSAIERRAVVWSGTLGWMGRGFVTSAVGWFVLQAAWQADREDARGFDRALRELASTDAGRILVSLAGLALIVYGIYCILSLRHRELEG